MGKGRDLSQLWVAPRAVQALYGAVGAYARTEALADTTIAGVDWAYGEFRKMAARERPTLSADALLIACEIASHILARPERYPLTPREDVALRRALLEGRVCWEGYQRSEAAFKGNGGAGLGCGALLLYLATAVGVFYLAALLLPAGRALFCALR